MRARILHLAAVLLGGLVLWAPAPFGSVYGWAHTVLRVMACAIVAVALVARTRWPREAGLAALALAAVALLGLAQSVSWPAPVARFLAPRLATQWQKAQSPGTTAGWVPLSLSPQETRSFALTWAAVAACGLAAAVAGRQRTGRRILGGALIVSGLFQVFYGTQSWMGSGRIWGREVANSAERLRGTFINADHFAMYLELVLPVVFAAGWWAFRRVKKEPLERKVLIAGPAVLAWLTLFVGLAFSGSRAGLVAGLFAASMQGLLIASTVKQWRPGLSGVLAIGMGGLAVAFIGLQEGLGRWLATSRFELTWNARLDVYARTIELWQRFPLLGTGLATFREAFPTVQQAASPGAWWHAHNDYLEVLATTGIVGAILVGLAVFWVVKGLLRTLRDGHHTEDRCAAVAALGALAAVAIHSCFDFGLTMPANAATLAILCGLGLAAGEQQAVAATPEQPRSTPPPRPRQPERHHHHHRSRPPLKEPFDLR